MKMIFPLMIFPLLLAGCVTRSEFEKRDHEQRMLIYDFRIEGAKHQGRVDNQIDRLDERLHRIEKQQTGRIVPLGL